MIRTHAQLGLLLAFALSLVALGGSPDGQRRVRR